MHVLILRNTGSRQKHIIGCFGTILSISSIFRQPLLLFYHSPASYFEEILHVKKDEKDDETFFQEALSALSKLYEEFHIAFSYEDIANDPGDHQQLVDIIESFGPMNSLFMPVPSEKLTQIIEDAISGNLS